MSQIQISQDTVKAAQEVGVDHTLLERLLSTADTVQHFMQNSNDATFSWPIFAPHMKKVVGQSADDTYIMLVQSIQEGDTYKTGSFFRVYPDQIAVSEAAKPMDVLQAFLDKYGMQM